MKPHEVVDQVLDAAKEEVVVRVIVDNALNLRWANSTTTTNGATSSMQIAIGAIKDGRVGTIARDLAGDENLAELVAQAEKAAAGNPESEDKMPLAKGDGSEPQGWAAAAVDCPPSVFSSTVEGLAQVFDVSRASAAPTFGYAEHDEATIWFGSSAGIRRRESFSRGNISFTTRLANGRSTWGGEWVSDWSEVDPGAMYETMVARLKASEKHVDLPAGRYEVILSPSAVADVFTYFLWLASLRGALDGQSPFSTPGGGTRIGEKLTDAPITISSDPTAPGLTGPTFSYSTSSGAMASIFDAGLDVASSEFVRDGTLVNLIAPRATAAKAGLERVPAPSNLIMAGEGPTIEEMIANTERGLLLNALWYIRLVDPRAMLLTGLTRDGVYLIEDGKIQGEVNNFRWNVSPLDVLANVLEIGQATNTLPREFETQLACAPPLRVKDWFMSSVSEAT